MCDSISLTGMTWSDPRGYDPVVAAAKAFCKQHSQVSIHWDKRSLQGFESTPVEDLAAQYDLMIIDHPHVGAVVASDCLLPLDEWAAPDVLLQLSNQTVGKSYASYFLDGHQWAFPVDAATQVQAYRPDLGSPAATWTQVIAQAKDGKVILPLRPPHSLMCFFTLAANLGHPCATVPGDLLPQTMGERVFEALLAVSEHLDPAFFGMDPIAALDVLAEGSKYTSAPLAYLYKGYANAGYRAHALRFCDMPSLGRSGPIGSALGGTGIAVSARSKHPQTCADFASWLAGATCQTGLYSQSNGQPGNAIAWADQAVNSTVSDAYFNTRLTHEAAWLRPRHAGYMAYQNHAAEIVNDVLIGNTSPQVAMQILNQTYRASFQATGAV